MSDIQPLPRRGPQTSALAALVIVTSMVVVTVLVGSEKILLNKGSTAAPASGCSALPKQPRPIPRDPIAARAAAEVIAFGRATAPPDRVALNDGQWARLKIKVDSFVAGYNQFKCVDLLEVYQKLGADGVLPADFMKPETQRLMLFITAAVDGPASLPVFAVAPVSVSDQARPVILAPAAGETPLPANTDQPTFRVSLAVNRFVTSLPSPEAAVTIRLVNTTAKTLSQTDLGKLGLSKWSVSVTASSGGWTASKDIPPGALTTLAPGTDYTATDIVVLKGPADRRLEPGPAILTGQLTTKGKPLDASSAAVRIDPI